MKRKVRTDSGLVINLEPMGYAVSGFNESGSGSSNFVGSESGQIQSVKTPAEYGLQTGLNTPHPFPSTHCLYILYFDTGKGERGEVN
jgi:hypothetical protein